MRTIVAGNWKMNKDRAATLAMVTALIDMEIPEGVEVIIAPAFPFLDLAVEATAGTHIRIAAQNCHEATSGAFTGEVSAGMLKSIGVNACIVGHSERRQYFNETDTAVAKKITALLEHGITPIYCCGELKEERLANTHAEVITRQMKTALGALDKEAIGRLVIAYEPVWAIGTGLTATAAQAQEVHALIRSLLRAHDERIAETIPVLYGGSCKPDNAAELFANPDVSGGLIGGAALDAGQFSELIRIAGEVNT